MGKISTYPKDTNVTGLDILLGSDANTPGKITKNFSTNALASYFNKSAIIDTGQFSWEFLPYNNTQPQPEKTFMKVDWLDDTININNLAGVLRVSALTLGNTQPGAFIENEWVGNNILIHLPSAPSAYAIYTVDALVPDGDWYYLMTISYVGGQSFVIQKNEPVVMGYFAGANVITEITGTFPIIVSEGSIPDVSIDETKLGEWNLAFNSTITSASVTGTTTKTLTLTEQDGGTITASWTDEDTNLVTSVFGRTGAVVAVSGDYNTSQVTESTNLYFTQARAIASPITGYNPVAGTITASDTILTAINKLSGNISGGYVPYTGATTNVNLGEKGITAGYVGFDLTPTATPTGISTMYWDSAYRTVSLIDGDGDTTLQIGQEERILVHNNTGSTLTDGQVVYVTGSTGNLPSVSLANASSETTSAATLGVVTEGIANGADGFITVSGMVNGLNTLAFTEGDLLWLSETAGQFTNVKPISPAHLVLIGYVIKRAGGNGSILVKIQNTQELSESSDVLISAPEIDGQGLFLQTISGVQLWRNRSIVDVLGYTPADEATTLTINGTTYDLSANRTWSVGTVTSIAVGLGTSGTDVNVSGSPITSSGTITLNIPSASAVNRGLLTPTDWTTFNNKQDAGNYITSLTGEATASGPGAAAVTLSTPAVTGKLLTGVNITGGTVVATDTILEAFGKVQNQINGLVGGSIYKGTWNAATNTPTITSGVGNTGWYYIVSVSGSTNIDGITDWNLGDWIIFDGTAWQQVDNTDAVVSVNGYTGAVSLVSSDVPEGLTNLYFTNARARGAVSLTTTGSSGAATYDSGTGVFNIPNYGSALSGYLTLSGGTLTGGLYINPQNTSTVGLDVASNTVTLRSDNLEGFKRQLTTTMSSGTLIKIQAAGYGGTYVTDLGFYTSSNSAVNTTPNLYLTGGDNRVGINTITPGFTLDVQGTAGVSGVLTLGSSISNGTYSYTLPSATGTLALTSDIPSLTNYVTLNTVQNISAVKNFNAGLTANVTTTGTEGFYSTNTSGSGASINLQNDSVAGVGMIVNISTAADGIQIGNDGSGRAIYISNSTLGGYGNGVYVENYDNGTGIQVQSSSVGDAAYFAHSAGRGLRIYSSATGYGLIINNATSATSIPFTIQKQGVNRIVFTDAGAGTFTSSVTATNFILSGGTGSTGLYYGHTDRVVLANYTTGGIDFEVNGGSIVATLFPSGNYGLGTALDAGYKLDVNGTARISGALSGTSASFSGAVTVLNANINLSNSYYLTGRNSANNNYLAIIGRNSSDKIVIDPDGFGVNVNGNTTFTGNVGIRVASSGDSLNVLGTANNNTAYFAGSATSGQSFGLQIRAGSSITDYSLLVQNNSGADYFRIVGNGAATFSSSVTASKLIVDGASNGNISQFALTRTDSSWGLFNETDLRFYQSNSNTSSPSSVKMVITTGGNVGIGTTAPNASLTIVAPTSSSALSLWGRSTDNYSAIRFESNTGASRYATIYTNAADLIFETTAERMRITSSGSVLVGTTSTTPVSSNILGISLGNAGQLQASTDGRAMLLNRFTDGTLAEFHRGGNSVGSISVTSVMTSFNVTSDYRLKEDLKPINGLEIVNKIKVYDYKWKANNSRMDGVIAHELQEILPYAVTGVKDGEQMQSVDYSKIVPVMVQAIKDLKAELDKISGKV